MTTFTYKSFYRVVYRFGNLLITPILLVYMLPAILTFSYNPWQILYLASLAVIIVYVNKLYLRLYNILPFKIDVDSEKITCTQFLRRNQKVILDFSEIRKLSGGVFYGKSKGLMLIEGENGTVGFFHHLTNANILITKLLQNVPAEVYKQIEMKIKSRLEK